jgi:uncharacterized protein YxjI
MLSESECDELTNLIHKLNSGRYTIKDIYGERWVEIKSNGNSLGKRFKKSVSNGKFASVTFDFTKTNNHATYIVQKL